MATDRPTHKQALPVGYRVQNYRIDGVLGVGGFGVTYLASHATLGHRVAIKEYLPNEFAMREGTTVFPKSDTDREDFDWGLARFLDEAKTLARFEHRNLVRVRDYFEANRTAYIVMDYEDGEPLDRLLDRHGRLTEAQLLRVLLPVVEGLQQVHDAGYLHRDIKPSNVFVRRADESPVLLDFGAARQALGHKSKSLTAVASAGYSPPEQYESEGEQGPWTDIYALSALCYRAITGDAPIEAPRRQSRLLRGQPDPLARLADVAPKGYSKAVLEAVDAGLRVVETERPASLAEWVGGVGGRAQTDRGTATTGLAGAAPAATGQGAEARGIGLSNKTLGIGAVAVLAAVAVGAWYWSQSATFAGPNDVPREAVPVPVKPVRQEELPASSPIGGGKGILVVETEPAGVEVAIGGAVAGTTPLQVRDVRAGTYAVRLRHPHYDTVLLENQTVAEDEVLRIERMLSRATGKLTVLTKPAQVWIERDGTRLAEGTPVTLDGLPAGPVQLTLGAIEHETIRVDVDVPKDAVGTLERTLRRIPHGTLTLELDPADATVTLPHIEPAYRAGMRLPEGEHRVTVRRAGYREMTQTVTVSGDTRRRIGLEVDPQAQPGETFSDTLASGGEGPRMVVIPAGSFRMGCVSGRNCEDDEHPVHEVTLSEPFALSMYEVTFADWERCTNAGGCNRYRPSDRGWGRGNRPAIYVSWERAQSYASWLSRETAAVYRLPSESEWEYAARAGTVTSYSWGNETGRNRANCDGCGSRRDDDRTVPVGSFTANQWGLHDMHGNVWEWVEDCSNDSYTGAPLDGSAWLRGNCARRMLRGGSWNYSLGTLRSANRGRNAPGYRSSFYGFRVARTLTP